MILQPLYKKIVKSVALLLWIMTGDNTTKWPYSGTLVHGNMAPLIWYSKQQNKVKANTFSSEFVATMILIEMLIGTC